MGGSGWLAQLAAWPMQHAQGVIHVVDAVDEGRETLAHDVVQRVARLRGLEILGAALHALALRPLELAAKDLQLPHLVDHALVLQKLDILHQIVGLGLPLDFLARLPRVDALEDAYLPKVLERELQPPERLGTSDVVLGVTLLSLLLAFPRHSARGGWAAAAHGAAAWR
jgi:hypothetical protein